MSDENIIAMLTAETLRPADSAGFPDTEVIFQRRRGLSKLPVHAVDGEFLTPNVARFHIDGLVIDIPTNFGVAQFLEGPGGTISKSDEPEFFSAIASLIGAHMDSLFVIRASEGNPWLVFWDSHEGQSIEDDVVAQFYPPTIDLAQAA